MLILQFDVRPLQRRIALHVVQNALERNALCFVRAIDGPVETSWPQFVGEL